MSGSANWPIAVTGYDSLRLVTKRVDRQSRNASPISAADLLGPAMSSQAVHILDWNDEIATFNGFVYTTAGGLNAPVVQDEEGEDVEGLPFIGTIIAREDGTGTQQAWNTDDPGSMYFRVRNWAPNPDDPTAPPIFGEWQRFATRSGFIAEEDLHPDVRDDIDQALEDAEAALGLVASINKVYRQTSAPTDPDPDGRALVTNDTWFDSDNADRPSRWNGSAWVDSTTAWLDTNPTATYPAVVISPAGLVAYNAGGLAVTTIDSSNGFLTTVGSVFSAADISGSTVTGGTVQTTATVARGVKMNSAGFVAYDGAGSPTFVLDAATGAITMKGSLASGSFIYGARVRAGSTQLAALESSGGIGRLAFYNSSDTTYQGGVTYGFNTSMLDSGVSLVGPSGFSGAQVGIIGDDVIVDPVSGGTFYIFGPGRVNGNFHVQGNLTVSGTYPGGGGSWVGTATSNLNMSGYNITSVGTIAGTGGLFSAVTTTGDIHADEFYSDGLASSGTAGTVVHMGTLGRLYKFTSSRRYKTDIHPLAETYDVPTLLGLESVTYVAKDSGTVQVGVIAEQAHDAGLGQWVRYDEEDRPDSFDYPAWVSALQYIAQVHDARMGDLEAENSRLIHRIELLEAA